MLPVTKKKKKPEKKKKKSTSRNCNTFSKMHLGPYIEHDVAQRTDKVGDSIYQTHARDVKNKQTGEVMQKPRSVNYLAHRARWEVHAINGN